MKLVLWTEKTRIRQSFCTYSYIKILTSNLLLNEIKINFHILFSDMKNQIMTWTNRWYLFCHAKQVFSSDQRKDLAQVSSVVASTRTLYTNLVKDFATVLGVLGSQKHKYPLGGWRSTLYKISYLPYYKASLNLYKLGA
jgi:hypothetical protein